MDAETVASKLFNREHWPATDSDFYAGGIQMFWAWFCLVFSSEDISDNTMTVWGVSATGIYL